MHVIKDVAAAIIVRDGQVLVARRAAGQNLAGYWEFPGGKLEPGETVQACIVRELAEELNITCEAGDIFCEHLHRCEGGAMNLIAVKVQMTSDGWELSVHDDAQWVGPHTLLALQLAPADIPIAEAVRNVLLDASDREK
jgi:8-oxo-dGTP diphosphatase